MKVWQCTIGVKASRLFIVRFPNPLDIFKSVVYGSMNYTIIIVLSISWKQGALWCVFLQMKCIICSTVYHRSRVRGAGYWSYSVSDQCIVCILYTVTSKQQKQGVRWVSDQCIVYVWSKQQQGARSRVSELLCIRPEPSTSSVSACSCARAHTLCREGVSCFCREIFSRGNPKSYFESDNASVEVCWGNMCHRELGKMMAPVMRRGSEAEWVGKTSRNGQVMVYQS